MKTILDIEKLPLLDTENLLITPGSWQKCNITDF